MATDSKFCGRCKSDRPVKEFGPRKGVADGLKPWCKSCVSDYSREHYLRNKEKAAVRSAARYAANMAARKQQQRAWYEANAERLREKHRLYRENNKDYFAERMRVRRTRKRAGEVGEVDLAALWDGLCGICGIDLHRDLSYPHPQSPSVDHIVPLARGGSHTQDNLQWSHLRCNQSKGMTLPDAIAGGR